jgi:hypothetical protein
MNASIWLVRKLLSILLLAFVGLPAISPFFASTTQDEASLPACCRRNGKHHCMMSMGERQKLADSQGPQFAAPMDKCPYCPSMATLVTGSSLFLPPSANAGFAGLVSHPAGIAQTESKLRISRTRSRQKRGPPVVDSL